VTIQRVDIDIDVTVAAGLGGPASVRVTVVLPPVEDLADTPVVCFALPGATYSRKYFMLDLPDEPRGGQATWHAQRGWIFIAIDHLGTGESSVPDLSRLVFRTVTAANHAVVQSVLERLKGGKLVAGYPPLASPVVLGIGHSMGGCLTVIQQARHSSYDAIAVLGFSAVHTHPPRRQGEPRVRLPFVPRDTAPGGADQVSLWTSSAAVNSVMLGLSGNPNGMPTGWHYHFDDEPPEVVKQDMEWGDAVPPWRSTTMPGLILWVTAPGAIAPEAASILVPVLTAFGERDVLEDPRMEAKAYRSAVDFSMFICPRMAHMHNFATTRELLWTRIHSWGEHAVVLKALVRNWPSDLYSDTY
jgi:pimeloyl-ACP methyl ester carboxylesterase